MATHILNRFDINTICAGIVNIISKPGLFDKYQPFITDSDYFFHNDSSPNAKGVRKLLTVLTDIHKEGKSEKISMEFIDTYLKTMLVESETNDAARRLFNEMRTNDNITNKVNDPGCFTAFLEYLKIVRLAKHAGPMFKEYQSGKIDAAANHLSDALQEINKINQSEAISFDPKNLMAFLSGASKDYSIRDVLYLGCDKLDSDLGGFEPQTLNVFISVTNGGKSAMAHNLLRAALQQKKKVHIACVEDRPRSFLAKFIACNTGIPIRRLIKEFANLTTSEIGKIEEVQKLMVDYVKVDFVYGQNIDAIHKLKLDYDLECRMKGLPVPVVDIVDYTGHVARKTQGDKVHEQMRAAYGNRKDFALANNKICFDFAQINREGSKRLADNSLLSQSDLAGSYDLSQVCDNIISINRNSEDISLQKAKLFITKARDGQVGNIYQVGTSFESARYVFEDCVWLNPSTKNQ